MNSTGGKEEILCDRYIYFKSIKRINIAVITIENQPALADTL